MSPCVVNYFQHFIAYFHYQLTYFASPHRSRNRLDLVRVKHAIPAYQTRDLTRSLSGPADAVVSGASAHAVHRAALDHFAGRRVQCVQSAHASVTVGAGLGGRGLAGDHHDLPVFLLRHNLREQSKQRQSGLRNDSAKHHVKEPFKPKTNISLLTTPLGSGRKQTSYS